jgi:hypothetical protein
VNRGKRNHVFTHWEEEGFIDERMMKELCENLQEKLCISKPTLEQRIRRKH